MSASEAYRCSDCGGTFESERSDEAAHQEALIAFGRRGDAPGMAVVCDECYNDIMKRLTMKEVEDTRVNVRAERCAKWSEPWFKGSWRDWHRGHGCNLDDGKQRTEAAQQEINAHEAGA